MNLHICCGWTYLSGFVNIDIQGILRKNYPYPIREVTFDTYYPKEYNPVPTNRRGKFPVDLIHDICVRWPFEYNSIEQVVFIEGIEHFTIEEGEFIISEIYRVLKPTGTFIYSFPDIVRIFNEYAEKDFDRMSELLYCNHKDSYSIHKTAYNQITFNKLLTNKNRKWKKTELDEPIIRNKFPVISGAVTKC